MQTYFILAKRDFCVINCSRFVQERACCIAIILLRYYDIYIEFYQGMLHLNIHMGNCDVKSVIVFLREEKPCMRAFMKRVADMPWRPVCC